MLNSSWFRASSILATGLSKERRSKRIERDFAERVLVVYGK